ncbi:MAG: nodulation protein NfeD, partial [Campylobacteraceae bacterium]|nr:nodulation protein NfeD [Campylobacteraceae bacterium]
DILNSSIPVVIYVSPKGARAASAGTYLAYASHISVMAPGTNIGAATPVNLMAPAKPPTTPLKIGDKKDEPVAKQGKTAMEKKVINDAVAYIKSIAQLRKRNIPWAIEAVVEGKSISANDALEKNVIDLMANNVHDLLNKIHGRKVMINNKEIEINTKDAILLFFEASWKTKFFMAISNPSVAYIFLIIAMYGILFEMMNPGSIFPGVIGAISALIAMYALNILPFNYVGLFLIFLGIAFMIAEVFIAGIGVLGIGGVIAFAFGSILLFDPEVLGSAVSIPLIASFSLVSFAFFVYLLGFLVNARKRKVVSGSETLIGVHGKIIECVNGGYKVALQGEIWNATSDEEFSLNEIVVVSNITGLILSIRGVK